MKKTGTLVEIPLNKKALKLIGKRRKEHEQVFQDLQYPHINKKLKKWLDKAQITKKITFHCSRHTFATLLISRGADIYTVSKLLGHSSVSQTEKYAKVVSKKKTEAISLLDGI